MDKIKEKLEKLRLESESATSRAEKAESEVRDLQAELSKRETECLNLNNKIQLLQEDLVRQQKMVEEAKLKQSAGEQESDTIELLQRKISLLEGQVDEKEKGRKEAVENVRTLELKSETAERRVRQLEQEKADVEKKQEEMTNQYAAVKQELAETLKGLEDL